MKSALESETIVRKPFPKVLFATDFSRKSEQTLIEATRFATRYGDGLHLLHVVVRKGQRRTTHAEADRWDYAPVKERTAMEVLHRSVSEHVPTAVARVWRDTSVAEGILQYTQYAGIGLIVMGPGPRRRLWASWRSSVTQTVARTAPVSVLIPYGRVGNRRGILAAVDFSHESNRALVHASHLAVRHKQRLTVLHVARKLSPGIQEDLEGFVDRAKLMCEATCVTEKGDPAKAIVATAVRTRAEVVVVGASPGSPGPKAWSKGDVAHLLRISSSPVLIYRQGKPAA